jgi:hypothetical protein
LSRSSPAGPDWLRKIKCDGYHMHARLADGKAQLLTQTGLDWSKQYGFTVHALRSLPPGLVLGIDLQGAPERHAVIAVDVRQASVLVGGEQYRRSDGHVLHQKRATALDYGWLLVLSPSREEPWSNSTNCFPKPSSHWSTSAISSS